MKKIFLLLPLFYFSIIIAHAQISKDVEPFSFTNKEIQALNNNNTVILTPSKSIETALMEDEEEKMLGLPPRFGLKMDVNLNLNNSGTWTNPISARCAAKRVLATKKNQ